VAGLVGGLGSRGRLPFGFLARRRELGCCDCSLLWCGRAETAVSVVVSALANAASVLGSMRCPNRASA